MPSPKQICKWTWILLGPTLRDLLSPSLIQELLEIYHRRLFRFWDVFQVKMAHHMSPLPGTMWLLLQRNPLLQQLPNISTNYNKLPYLLKLDLSGHVGTGRNDFFFKHRYVCHLQMYICTSQLKTPSFLMIATISTHPGPGSKSCKSSDGRSCKDLGF